MKFEYPKLLRTSGPKLRSVRFELIICGDDAPPKSSSAKTISECSETKKPELRIHKSSPHLLDLEFVGLDARVVLLQAAYGNIPFSLTEKPGFHWRIREEDAKEN